MKRKYDEATSKRVLYEVLADIADLDTMYPNLGVPSMVRQLNAAGHFDAEQRPWDFLVLVGYVTHALYCESDEESFDAIYDIRYQVERIYQRPTLWMYNAMNSGVQERYLRTAGRSMPHAVISRWRMPRNLRGKVQIFCWADYEQLVYALRVFSRDIILTIPPSMKQYTRSMEIATVQEMRNLVASMECPPQDVLEKLTASSAEIAVNALLEKLYFAKERAEDIARLGYTLKPDSDALNLLSAIAENVGYKANFTATADDNSAE